jgi:hypothetical protein
MVLPTKSGPPPATSRTGLPHVWASIQKNRFFCTNNILKSKDKQLVKIIDNYTFKIENILFMYKGNIIYVEYLCEVFVLMLQSLRTFAFHNRPPFSSQGYFEYSDSKKKNITIITLIKYDTD